MPTPPAPRAFLRIDPDNAPLQPLELDPGAFQSPVPVQHYHLIFEDEDIGLAVGLWDTTPMQEAFGPYPGDEVITVLDGHFAMVDAAGRVLAAARAGDSVTFRNGAPSSWKQEGYLRKIYLTLQDPEGEVQPRSSAEGAFTVIPPDARPPAAGEVIFRNEAGTLTVTLRRFPAQDRPLSPCPAHRLIRVLAGAITLTDAAGQTESFGPDAHVFVPRGAACAFATAEGTVALITDVTPPSQDPP